ncbi:MAG: hypothetical protein CVU65_00335 [Deltaproteobacteria bacterium HGW-Deltaproteobacteria-22]|jgi:hypothetical protein|nr:MAG: hypothetical protein CVU65_00335 [Deltaproteobacteria bacterium HGW-Deltaproteobacteria-22]
MNTLISLMILVSMVAAGCAGGAGDTPPAVPDQPDAPALTPPMQPDPPAAMQPDPPPVEPVRKPATGDDWNSLARVLGGFSTDLPENFSVVRDLPAFKTYAERIEKMWKPVEQKKSIIEKWVKTELETQNRDCKTLFYPFSGPDFLHVHLLFPGCRDIVMIGLEPAGSLPELSKILDKPEKFFAKMEASLTHILTLSFFRTKSMKDDLFGKEVPEIDGTLPPILFMMARTGQKLTSIGRVQLDWDGKVVPWTGAPLPDLPEPPAKPGRKVKKKPKKVWIPYSGLKYTYLAPGETTPRTLTYFSCNLANETYREVDGILARPDLQKYLGKLEISTTYTKAASYLMHEGNFHWIRSFILEHSPSYLQDDSGIPLQYFDEKKWSLRLYGHYDVPIQLFLKYTQPELARRYAERKKIRTLPFGIGYKVWPGRSNLQLAVRK